MESLRPVAGEHVMLEVRLILAHVLDVPPQSLVFLGDIQLTSVQQEEVEHILARRLQHEPLSRIFGQREFWSLPFKISPATLDPRPDSETLIEAVLKTYPDKNRPLKILDLGTGSGCLLLVLLHEYPNASGVGVDLNPAAAVMAQQNADCLNLANRSHFVVASWTEAIGKAFDLVISNPPYIPSQDIPHLAPDVRAYDPLLALDGGDDGLNPYREIISSLRRVLKPHGHLFVEVGHDQADAVADLMIQGGLVNVCFFKDLAGIRRIVAGLAS